MLAVSFVALAGSTALAAEPAQLTRFEFTEAHMAVDFRIVLYAADGTTAKQAAAAAFARIKQLDECLSDYSPTSELSKLSDTAPTREPVHVSDDLWRVLVESKKVSTQTNGAFDCTVGPVVKLWRRARRTRELPSADAIAAAREAVGDRFLELDAANHTVRLLKPKMRLDLGGIAKGFAADAALAILKQHSISSAFVAGSGDIAIGDRPPGKPGWRIAVAALDPKDPATRFVEVANVGVSTSGDSLQHVEIGGKRYSHVVDPRTGMALTSRSSETVVAANATASDGLSTGVGVLGPNAGIEAVEKVPKAAALVVDKVEDKLEAFESTHWHEFEAPAK